MKKIDAIILNKNDNVATSLKKLHSNEKIVVKIEDRFYKIYFRGFYKQISQIFFKIIKKGEKVFKYGEVIGIATKDIKKGKHVHVDNITSSRN